MTTVTAKAALLAFAVALSLSAPALADCKEPKIGSDAAPMFSPPLGEVVIGKGRLQFYSAPNLACAMSGVFVIPNDKLTAYAAADGGWEQVMYMNDKTGDVVSGWVKSSRLKVTGTMGPKWE
jgi:hypothetical protein